MTTLDDLEDLLRKGEKEKAYELVKEDKGITAEILINEAITFGTIEEHSLSISYLELAEKIGENNEIKGEAREKLAVAYNNRGNAYSKLKQHEKAIGDFSKAIELNPKEAGFYFNRGSTYLKLNRYKKAIEDFDRAIELNPEDTEAYLNCGVAHRYLSQYEEAIEDLNRAIELNPKDGRAYSNRGSVYIDLRRNEEAIEDYNKAMELNPNLAAAYVNRGVTLVQTNEELDKAIGDFKHARDLFEGKDKERMLGIIEWAKARKEMNMKNWDDFRERMNEAREIFEKINDPLSLSFVASIKFSYLDEELDNALNIPNPIEALKEIETALKNPPNVEGLIDPERTIFGARILSFAIISGFISSVRSIDENTDLEEVKEVLTKLHKQSKEVEKMFESVNFDTGKTTIVDIQRIISSVKHEIVEIKWAPDKKQKALEILKNYWLRLSFAIKMMNGVSTLETEKTILIREIDRKMEVGFAETKGIVSGGVEKISEEIHKAKKEI
ncbi:MAG: tetratricopeptide repeat protein, partial [Methanophagales archaeon]|nr:tetratricopeptide repeat protein [Methanophagales archaeon]